MVKPHISISALKCFQNCPQNYYKKYILKEREERVGNALVLGTAVHETIEQYTITGGSIDPISYFKGAYDTRKFEIERDGAEVIYDDWNSYKDDIERGSNILHNYLSKSKTPHMEPIYCEVPFAVEIPGIEDVYLYGVIDGITESRKILEYKTTKGTPPDFFIKNDLQLNMYAYALKYGRPVHKGKEGITNEKLLHLFGEYPDLVRYIALHSCFSKKKPWQVNSLYFDFFPDENIIQESLQTIREIWATIKWCTETNNWPKTLKGVANCPCTGCPYLYKCWGKNNSDTPEPYQHSLDEFFRGL